MAGMHHEITRREAIDRGRRPQDQRQPRRGVLERHEGNLGPAEHHAVRAGRRDRQQPPARQPVVGDPAFRAGLFPLTRASRSASFGRLKRPPRWSDPGANLSGRGSNAELSLGLLGLSFAFAPFANGLAVARPARGYSVFMLSAWQPLQRRRNSLICALNSSGFLAWLAFQAIFEASVARL